MRNRPWSSLAREMAKNKHPEPDYNAWLMWLKGNCPMAHAALEDAMENADHCFRELYNQFTGNGKEEKAEK